MIQIRVRRDEKGALHYGPVLLCDMCKRPIEDIALALYKWQESGNGRPVDGTLAFLHKGVCDDAHNQAYNADLWHWSEGTAFLGYLVNAVLQMTSEEPLWPFLIAHYCPGSQLESVRDTANQIVEDPGNRPLSLHDL